MGIPAINSANGEPEDCKHEKCSQEAAIRGIYASCYSVYDRKDERDEEWLRIDSMGMSLVLQKNSSCGLYYWGD